MSDQILGVLVGGAVAILSGLAVALTTEYRGRSEWRRQARLVAAAKAIRALQGLNREITTLAIAETCQIDGTGAEWEPFHRATAEWNSARHEAALICPEPELQLLARLDRELDKVLEAAVVREWDPSDFRRERAPLGALASDYVRAARKTANEGSAGLPSIWSWASDLDQATRRSGRSQRTEQPAGASDLGEREGSN